jgi:protein transport protein SEC24
LNEYNQIQYPPLVRVSGERFDPSGAYVMENGREMVMWISRGIPASFLEDVFGVSTLAEVDIQQVI